MGGGGGGGGRETVDFVLHWWENTITINMFAIGIEDTFRTAATEVSLLAGSEDFNATKLFEVGKQLCQSSSNR